MDILAIVDSMTILLKYFIPGAICIKLFSFLYYRTEISDCDYFVFKSIILSGIIIYPLETVYTQWNDFALFTASIIIGVLMCLVISKILESDCMQEFLQKLHIRKTSRLYLGYVEYYEEKMEGDIYISISELTIRTNTGEKCSQDSNVRLIFNTANVERLILKSAKK